MENLAIGVDIEDITRFRKFDRINNASFLNKIFTEDELNYSFSKEDPFPHLAVRYAGKEAVVKALCGLEKNNVSFKEIEIIRSDTGIPFVKFKKEGLDDIKIKISLSHCKDKALAFVVICN